MSVLNLKVYGTQLEIARRQWSSEESCELKVDLRREELLQPWVWLKHPERTEEIREQ